MSKPGMAVQSVCAGGAYAILYFFLKDTPSHFNLSAGLRLAALMLLPMRLWPAILLGDMWANAVYASPRFGVAPYTALSSVIAIALHPISSLPAALMAKRLRVDLVGPAPRDVWAFLAIIITAAAVNALSGLAFNLSIDVPSAGRVATLWATFELYLLGVVLGALTLIPAAAWLAHVAQGTKLKPFRLPGEHWRRWWLLASGSALGLAAAVTVAIAAGQGHLLLPLRLIMFVPVVICTLRDGPRGAAISVLLANLAIDLTPFAPRDVELVRVQEISVLVCITAMLFGAHGHKQQDSVRQSEAREERALAYVRRFESASDWLRDSQANMLDRLYENLAATETALRDPSIDRQQAQQLWWRIISRTRNELRSRRDALRPALLESRGLKGAVLDCPILAALHEAGVSVHLHLVDDTSRVAVQTQYVAYQLIHEALAEALQRSASECVSIRIRSGSKGSRRWLAVRIVVNIPSEMVDEVVLQQTEQVSHLQDIAEAYGGAMRRTICEGRHIVAALLYDQSIEQLMADDAAAQRAVRA